MAKNGKKLCIRNQDIKRIYSQDITKVNIIYQVIFLNIIYMLKQKYNYIHVLLTVSRTQPTEFPTASPGDGLGLYSRWRLTCPDNTQDH
jgi:hypothetical protein